MRESLELARRGRGRVEPNPMVGAVVVRDGRVAGRGHHEVYGGPHAEILALREAGGAARGATVYVTLEPCGHEGKTPPCAEALLEAGVARVVYGATDPNPRTAGKGPEMLAAGGVEVAGGLLSREARELNARYARHLESQLPWTVAKWAMTLDGKIADVSGASRHISGAESRRLVHEIRGAVDAIAVGIGTVLADDPDLTARDVTSTRSPVRVVLDSRLRTPLGSRLVRTAASRPTWIAARMDAPRSREEALREAGCRVIGVRANDEGVDLRELWATLEGEGIRRILLEGGGEVHFSALSAGIVRQVMAFVATTILGGSAATTPVGGDGLRIGEALHLADATVRPLGDDVLVEGFLD